MRMIYTGEPMPYTFHKSIFLAGPTPRTNTVQSWRPEALKILEALGYDGVVYVPENRDGAARSNYDDQVGWEHLAMDHSDCVLFWVPRELKTMPAFTTNIEFGTWWQTAKLVFGAPEEAAKNDYLKYCSRKAFVPIADTLEETLELAMKRVGAGAYRIGGQCEVPLMVWNTKAFQLWHNAQEAAGNRLDGAKVVATFRVGPKKDRVYIWILHVNIHIGSEGRNKTNEPVIGRLDTSAVVLYRAHYDVMNTEIVLGREFRSPARNADGFVWELPAGSNPNPAIDPLTVAQEELFEETGFRIEKERLVSHGSRQLAATLLTHHANLYSAEINSEEIAWFKSQIGVPHGADLATNPTGERVYTQVCTLREILEKKLVDWSTVGMIMSVLNGAR